MAVSVSKKAEMAIFVTFMVVYATFTAISAPKNKIKIKTISLRACAREKKEFFMIKKGDKTKWTVFARARHHREAIHLVTT